MKNVFTNLLISIGIYFLLFMVTIVFAGIGHGSYIPMKLIFPFSMLSAIPKSNINIFEFIIAFIQTFTYVTIITTKFKWRNYMIVLHILAIIIVFLLEDNTFN